jgi:hypothetical protein
MIGIWLGINLFLLGFHPSLLYFHLVQLFFFQEFLAGSHFLSGGSYFSQHLFHLHSMAVYESNAVSNPTTSDTSCHVLE